MQGGAMQKVTERPGRQGAAAACRYAEREPRDGDGASLSSGCAGATRAAGDGRR